MDSTSQLSAAAESSVSLPSSIPPVGLSVPCPFRVVAEGAAPSDLTPSARADWLTWGTRTILECTNAFIWDPTTRRALLGWKKRGFGMDLYNGFGGKKDPGESINDAALRELQEECGIRASLKHAGILLFIVGETLVFEVHIYAATSWEDEPRETDEMRPEWFSIDEIPYDKMWPDDPFWLPLLYQDRPFIGRADFATPDPTKGERFAGKMLRWWFAELEPASASQASVLPPS
ncbi:NUDIX hydrolase domain-like protein [Auriculariales sp. MPI-PUGE-AT-0066]|nr:NUDIX hydrolase domain-like protein [Auriculariales sp. MPI-PUGE-AT-0066]